MWRESDNDLETDDDDDEVISFGLEVESDVKKAYCSLSSSSISLVTLLFLSWLH